MVTCYSEYWLRSLVEYQWSTDQGSRIYAKNKLTRSTPCESSASNYMNPKASLTTTIRVSLYTPYLPQDFSSDASPQSSLLSQTKAFEMHFLLMHLNWVELQPVVTTAQDNSSEPSPQSSTPSHCCHLGMQTLLEQRNCVWRQLWVPIHRSKTEWLKIII